MSRPKMIRPEEVVQTYQRTAHFNSVELFERARKCIELARDLSGADYVRCAREYNRLGVRARIAEGVQS